MTQSHHIKYRRLPPAVPDHPLGEVIASRAEVEAFAPTTFGLDNFECGEPPRTALAAMFDLQGFTDFSAQSDPHLCVPRYLDEFVTWLFDTLRRESIEQLQDDAVRLAAPLPFYAKFLGDGLLFLWHIDYDAIDAFTRATGRDRNVEAHGDIGNNLIGNVIATLHDICNLYEREFYPRVARLFTRVPRKLRCGVAQGLVCPLGNGVDYVGPCINMAARLQKLGSLRMCILQRGFDVSRSPADSFSQKLIAKRVSIRGAGDENVYVFRNEWDKLDDAERRQFIEP